MRLSISAVAALLLTLLTMPAAAASPAPPHDPIAGQDGTATMHGDPESSDTTPYAGPGANAAPGVPTALPADCPTILAGHDGLVQMLCTEYADRAPSLYLVDPATGLVLARDHLASSSLLGGVYAYLDRRDRMVTVTGSRLVVLAHGQSDGGWTISTARSVDLGPRLTQACGSTTCDAVATVAPGFDHRIWFATTGARVGYVTRAGVSRLHRLGPGERVANSISTAPGGVAVTTDHATYLVRSERGRVDVVWRRAYDRGRARKPGQLSWGSGATPTFFGPHGTDFIAYTDNARPREHLIVVRASTGRTVCTAPILSRDNSGTENSPIGYGRSVYVASTYGYPYPAGTSGTSEPASADFVGGMQRFTVPPRGRTCRLRWTSDVASAAVPRLSRPERVIYTVARGEDGLTWSLVRISAATGRQLSATPLGSGPQSDTLQQVGTILPDGTLLQGTLSGFVTVRPSGQ